MTTSLVLAIDAGNSHLVLGAFERKSHGAPLSSLPMKTWRLSTYPLGPSGGTGVGTADEFRLRITSLLALDGIKVADLEAIVLASVVPAVTECAREAFPQAHSIDHRWPFSFRMGTEHPAQTGIDRLVNAEAVVREYGTPAIILDAGTATTICAVSSRSPESPESNEPVFLGGAILPGVKACRDALPGRAAQLFAVDLAAPPSAIGANTEMAMRSGVILGYASMLDGMILRFKKERPDLANARVITTGGMSQLFSGLCVEFSKTDPELTLKGIRHLYESLRNR